MSKVAAALVALMMVVLAGCADLPARTPAGIVRDPPPNVGSVVLPDVANGGAEFATKAGQDEILLVYFGFTSCPDVCPTTLSDVRQAVRDLDDELARRVDLAVITVDPGRDDAATLTAYAQTFVDGAHALRTEDDERLRAAADAYGAIYEVGVDEDGDVEVGHSAFLYGVDDQGHVRLTWSFGTPAADLTSDMEYLFDEGV